MKQFTFDQELINDLLNYGYYEADFSVENEYGAFRVTAIRHDKTDKVYCMRRHNGEIIELKELI